MTPDSLSIGGRNVSRETLDRLRALEALVQKWSPRINLVSRRDLPVIWDRHVVDSIQVFEAAPKTGHWADLGSGGGFPGLVVAILAVHTHPELRVTLVESDQRKAVFLRTAVRELSLRAQVITTRIENLLPLNADVLSARALADLRTLLGHCARHLSPQGRAVFPKGANWEKEIADARQEWRFEVDKATSRTDPHAVVLTIKGVSRV